MQAIRANELCLGLGSWQEDFWVSSVATDSREVCRGGLFVCIRGERTDGHQYALEALKQGAAGVLVQHPVQGVPPSRCLVVENPLDAMIAMGANYRSCFSPVVAAVTGSVGKTTTKELCYAVFSAFGETVKTHGNQNNEIGMPNTLFRLTKQTQYAVVEMGMQGRGEICKLTKAARPHGAIITNIGQAHLQQLGTRENILAAKMEICEGLCAGAPLVLNADNDLLEQADAPKHLQRVNVGLNSQTAQVTAAEIRTEGMGTVFYIHDAQAGRYKARIPAVGRHYVLDALLAYTLAVRLGLEAGTAAAALERYEAAGMRQRMRQCAGACVIEDCYNAGPDSMAAALAVLSDMKCQRRIAVLGDMLELGDCEEQAHEKLAYDCEKAKVDMLIAVGRAVKRTCELAERRGIEVYYCLDTTQAAQQLLQAVRPHDAVLVKASRGIQLERVLDAFYQAKQGDVQVSRNQESEEAWNELHY